ncbi:MAG: HNH endonuclease [Cyanobacteria bacterium P01_G01_bin.19]
MSKKPNPLQKFVRGIIKESIEEANSYKNKGYRKPKNSKKKSKSATNKKRSRYISSTVRYAVLHRDNYRCVACEVTAKEAKLQIDHIIPFSKGGSNDMDNLQTLCISCNRGKSNLIF